MEHSQPLFVPVRSAGPAPSPCIAVVTARLPEGGRVGLAFTSVEALAAAMGRSQPWIRLSLAAERALLAPLGVSRIQVDPALVAPPVPATTSRALAGARHAA